MYTALLRALTGVFLAIAVAAAFHADEIRASQHGVAVALQAVVPESALPTSSVDDEPEVRLAADEEPLPVPPDDAEEAGSVKSYAKLVPEIAEFRVAKIISDRPAAKKSDLAFKPGVYHRVYRITAYCDRGVTAAGVQSGVGQCAAPGWVPFGSEVYIPALDRRFIVTDRTHKRFRHNTVDLFIPSCRDCRQFGVKYLECEIRLPAKKITYNSRALHRRVAQYR